MIQNTIFAQWGTQIVDLFYAILSLGESLLCFATNTAMGVFKIDIDAMFGIKVLSS